MTTAGSAAGQRHLLPGTPVGRGAARMMMDDARHAVVLIDGDNLPRVLIVRPPLPRAPIQASLESDPAAGRHGIEVHHLDGSDPCRYAIDDVAVTFFRRLPAGRYPVTIGEVDDLGVVRTTPNVIFQVTA